MGYSVVRNDRGFKHGVMRIKPPERTWDAARVGDGGIASQSRERATHRPFRPA